MQESPARFDSLKCLSLSHGINMPRMRVPRNQLLITPPKPHSATAPSRTLKDRSTSVVKSTRPNASLSMRVHFLLVRRLAQEEDVGGRVVEDIARRVAHRGGTRHRMGMG